MMNPAHGVNLALWYIIGISAFLLLGITITMVYFVFRYSRKRNPIPSDIRDNYPLEVVWTIIPTLIALSMFYVGWKAHVGLRDVPKDAIVIEVVGQQFSWLFTYPNDKLSENLLEVPQGKPIRLNITSLDVIHSFYLPAYRVKVDAVKGMQTYAWFYADKVGEYDILCSEYCGVGHSSMLAVLKIVPEAEYKKWLETEDE